MELAESGFSAPLAWIPQAPSGLRHYKGDLDGKVCRPDGKKAMFKVIDGGKKD
jgi:hypothetical protein